MLLGTYYHSKLLLSLLRKTQGKLLDVGGREGFLLHLLPGSEKYVVDLCSIPTFSEIHYFGADALKMPFKNNFFQTVFSFNTIEHIAKPEQFINSILRVTSSGGRIFILTPHPEVKIWPAFITGWAEKNLWHHNENLKISAEDFRKLLGPYQGKIKWRIVYLRNFFYLLFYLPLWVIWQRSESKGKFFVDQVLRLDKKWLLGGRGTFLVMIEKK